LQIVILAGGMGTRIRALAGDKPKVLVPVLGRPFLEHQVELLRQQGMTDLLFCVGYKAELVTAHLGDGSRFGVKAQFAFEDPNKLLGTAGAILNAWAMLQDEFMVLYGDSYLPINYADVARSFQERNATALMTVFKNHGAWDASNVRAEGDTVVFYSKKAKPGEADSIDYGLSVYKKSTLEPYLHSARPLDLGEVQRQIVGQGKMAAYQVSERFYEVGKPEGVRDLEAFLSAKNVK
jgi:NDP-sugar pyrophosphorylase family protein